MKKLFLLYLMSCSFGATSSLLVADGAQHASFCDSCGAPIRVDFISIYKSNGEGERLLCKKCLKRMRGRKGGSSSPSSSSSSLFIGSDNVFDSPPPGPQGQILASGSSAFPLLTPSSPFAVVGALPRSISVPATFFIDEKRAAELAEFTVEQRLKAGIDSGTGFLVSYGEPTTFDEALSLKIRLFEKLYEASKMPEDEKYKYTLHEVKKCADVIDPQGNEHFFTVDGSFPFFWKRGGVFVFKRAHSLEVQDLTRDCSYSFPDDTLSLAVLKAKCQDYGFEKVGPLTPYQEASSAHQAAIDRLPSPDFSK